MSILETLGLKKPLKSILPLAGLASNFIPGLGPIVGAVGGLISGADNEEASTEIQQQQQSLLNQLLQSSSQSNEMYQKYLQPALTSMAESIFGGDGGVSAYANPRIRAATESAGRVADAEIARAGLDFGGRGLLDSSGMNSAATNARARVGATDLAATRQYGEEARQDRLNRLNNFLGLISSSGQINNTNTMNALGGLGGMKQFYASKQDGILSSLGQLGDIFGTSKTKGTPPFNPNAGNNRLGTNQSGTPVPPGATPGQPYQVTAPTGSFLNPAKPKTSFLFS